MHPLLRAVADRQDGIVTARDARRAGYDHGEIRHLCTSGRWVRLRRGIHITAPDLADRVERHGRHRLDCVATPLTLGPPTRRSATLRPPGCGGCPSGGGLDRTVRLTDPHHWRRGQDHVVTRAPLPSSHVATDGPLRLTSPARTPVDCAREWPLGDAVVAMDAALLAGCTTPRS